MNNTAMKIARRMGRSVWKALRFVLYIFLLVLGRILLPISSFAVTIGIVVFLFCLILRPDLSIPMWAGAGLAVTATAVSVFYEAALRAVAPADVVIVSDA